MAIKVEEIKVNLEELKEFKRKNMEERLKFVDFWANYVKTHPDKEWSKQQNIVIDAQIKE